MNPEPGDYVKVLFNNGTAAEGFVRSWSDAKSVLETESQDSFFVIQKTLEDVLAVKIFPGHLRQEEAEQEFEEVRVQPRTQTNIKKLAELRTELNRQERDNFFNQIQSHKIGQIRPVDYHVYSVPQATSQRGPQLDPTTQAPRTNLRGNPGLPEMFQRQDKINR